jgi:hypothetical protein
MPNGRPPASLIHACSAATYLRRADRPQSGLPLTQPGEFPRLGLVTIAEITRAAGGNMNALRRRWSQSP